MAASLKTFFSPALVRRLARDIAAVHPEFPTRSFVTSACRGLDALELLDRSRHISRVLGEHLPAAFPDAIGILLRSLGPELETDELLGVGMAPFFYLPHTMFVAERGLDHFDLSLDAQYHLTKRCSAEASIRAFIARDPARTFGVLRRWTTDANPHVRRLVSEGTRLRLPWAPRVAWLDEHPDQVLALLHLLKDDPATMVRRSVANNLNDLGKLQPALLVRTARTWLHGASSERRQLLQHALRSAVKRGDAAALRVLGYGATPKVRLEAVTFTPPRVRIGARVAIAFRLRSTATQPQELLVDVAVKFVKARDKTSSKVFKVSRLTLPGRGSVDLRCSVSLAIHTTRKPRPGRHLVEVMVNGQALPAGPFHVLE